MLPNKYCKRQIVYLQFWACTCTMYMPPKDLKGCAQIMIFMTETGKTFYTENARMIVQVV